MVDIPTTQAIAWGWVEFPHILPSGVSDADRVLTRQYRTSLFVKVRAELKPHGFEPVVLYASTFSLIRPSNPRVAVFKGDFTDLCRFATRYLTEEGNP